MKRLLVTLLVGVLLAAVLLVAGASVQLGRPEAGGAPPVTYRLSVSGTVAHVRVTLSVPDRVYPRNALIRVSVRVHNLAHHIVSAEGTSCTQTNPSVNDYSAAGKNLYPNRIHWFNLLPPCGATTEDTFMPPGYNVTYHVLTIAFGPILRAKMWIRPADRTNQIVAMYPRLHLRLGPRTGPKIHVQMIRGYLTAHVAPWRSGMAVEYVTLAHCYPGKDPWDYLGYFWSPAPTGVIKADCARPTQWRLLVGAIGSSVTNLNYRRPKA